jgi:hypothetical protein
MTALTVNQVTVETQISDSYKCDRHGVPLKYAEIYFQNSKRRNHLFTVGSENNFLGWNDHIANPKTDWDISETYAILSAHVDLMDKRKFHNLPIVVNTEFGSYQINSQMKVLKLS